MQQDGDGAPAGWLPRGRWFMPAWMVAGALLDFVVLRGLPLLTALFWQRGSSTAGSIGLGLALINPILAVWSIHAVAMPLLATGGTSGRHIARRLALGVGGVAAAGLAALLVAICVGGIGAGIAMSAPPDLTPGNPAPPGFFSVVSVSFLVAHALAGAAAGAVLHPFLAAALPHGARVRFWRNVAGGTLAAVALYLPTFLYLGYAFTPDLARVVPAVRVASWVLPTAGLLPHLWFVGQAVRRSLAPVSPA